MSYLVENPWPGLLVAAFIELALGILLVRGGRAWVIIAMAGVLVAAVAFVVIERLVVTDKEEIENSLEMVAGALEAHDVPGVLATLAPEFPRRAEVERVLARFEVSQARVGSDLEVRFNPLTNPPSATAYFTGHLEGKDLRGQLPYEHLIRKFKIVFRRDGDRWVIADYSDDDVSPLRKKR
jgi:hypothetical protein